jgi:uncharacterized spore protein YtfJ
MPNKLEELALSIISQLKEIAVSETIIGQPVVIGNKGVVPVSRVSVGFGVGGGEGETKDATSSFGGGGGGGVRVEPGGFIVIEEDKVSYLPTAQGKYSAIIDAIPGFIEKFRSLKKDKGEKDKEHQKE